jgi:hypothetical protein
MQRQFRWFKISFLGVLLRRTDASPASALAFAQIQEANVRQDGAERNNSGMIEVTEAPSGYGESHADICCINFRRTYTEMHERY